MAIQKIEAYRCTYCGKVMLSPEMHEFECRYEPKARTCTTCGFENELIRTREDGLHGACYCPRAEKVFSYPCAKYCPDYKRRPDFKEI